MNREIYRASGVSLAADRAEELQGGVVVDVHPTADQTGTLMFRHHRFSMPMVMIPKRISPIVARMTKRAYPAKKESLLGSGEMCIAWQHGHPYSKATRFWLKNLPLLQPTNVLNKYSPWCPSNTGSKTGSKHAGFASSSTRSHTFPGIAEAMAGQWGDIKSKNKG